MSYFDEDAERRLDEIEAVEAIYPAEFKLLPDGASIEALRAAHTRTPDDPAGPAQVHPLEFELTLGLDSEPAEVLVLTFELPTGYPSTERLAVRCRCDRLSKRQLEALATAVAAEVSGFELGCEAVLDIAGAALGHATAAVEAADAAKAAAEAAAAEKTRVLDVEWRRVFFWCNHLIEGKAHKKEAQVKDALAATDLTGAIYFGTPGIVAVEGPLDVINQFEKDARASGKALKPKKSQGLPNKEADRRFEKAELQELGLEHKLKHIIGVENLQG